MSQEKPSVEEFWKFNLRVGLIKEAERVPKSRKLIKLVVDFGDCVKTALAGLGDVFKPEDLVGKKFIFVTNIRPKKAFGIESQVMILVAEDDKGNEYLLPVSDEVPIGSKVY
ncbi:MAG TPA: methionine--tRNA ligase subunit beta [Acidilobales archaeon]|nr:MAG: methionine--tRNA ligase subunit beta [Desulfurococcales archaeon ex4484_42]HDD25827.1 methionine--tRNA ligase subunit beta [Acidilobales archaeon]